MARCDPEKQYIYVYSVCVLLWRWLSDTSAKIKKPYVFIFNETHRSKCLFWVVSLLSRPRVEARVSYMQCMYSSPGPHLGCQCCPCFTFAVWWPSPSLTHTSQVLLVWPVSHPPLPAVAFFRVVVGTRPPVEHKLLVIVAIQIKIVHVSHFFCYYCFWTAAIIAQGFPLALCSDHSLPAGEPPGCLQSNADWPRAS